MSINLVKIYTVAKNVNESVKQFNGERPYLSTGDLDVSKVDKIELVTFVNKPSRANLTAKKGDVIFARMQGTNKVLVIDEKSQDFIFSTGFMILRPSDEIHSNYLFHYLASNIFQGKKDKLCSGATQKALNNEKFYEIEIPLPPYKEQKRIAEILDKVQNVVNKQKTRIDKYDELTQSVFTEMFGIPIKNTKGFDKFFLKDVLKDIVAGTSYGGEERELKNNELGVLKISAVTSGYFLPKEYKAIPNTVIKKAVVNPKKGDLLFSRANTRELVGATCIVDEDYPSLFLPDKLWRLDLNNEKCDNYYLKAILTDIGIRNELTKTATGTSGSMLNISMNKLRDLEIPLPNISLQREFKKIVTRIDNQKIKSKINLEISSDLFSSLLQKAFNGELTKTK